MKIIVFRKTLIEAKFYGFRNSMNIFLIFFKMSFLRICLLALSLIGITSAGSTELIKFSVASYIRPDKQLKMELDVSVPRKPDTYPVLLFLTGLSGVLPSYFQSNLIDSVAQNGFAWLTITKLQSPNPSKITDSLAQVINWLNNNLQDVFNNHASGVVVDLKDRFILMSHSSAGHITTQYLNQTCGNVKMQILLDPVDGFDPFGLIKNYIITPGKFLPYATPVLVIASQLDSVPRTLVDPPCAPLNLSNERFYNAMSGPRWFLNISKYGHVDFWNNEYRHAGELICSTCKGNCNFTEYRELIKQVILSFTYAIFDGDDCALNYIEQASFKIPTVGRHNYMGYNPYRGGFCQRVNKQEENYEKTFSEQKNLELSAER